MVEHLTEELLIRRHICVPGDGSQPHIALSDVDPHRFAFKLCRKREHFGDIAIDQWWMPRHTVYGQRRRDASNGPNLIAYYWALCMQEGTVFIESVQETYILANLVPLVRSTGSRRVFADAQPSRRGPATHKKVVARELEKLLRSSEQLQLTKFKFHEHVMSALGPPEYGAEVENVYATFIAELLGEAKAALETQGTEGLEVAFARWHTWSRSVGRRSGKRAEKQVLDILSYESRTALHTCYSAVWLNLIEHLARKYDWNDETLLFHRLWHFDLVDKVEEPTLPNNRLFHGHVFALHPACANFALTARGRELLGGFLADPASQSAFRQLLGGLYVAIDDYARRHDDYAMLRKG